MWRLWCVYIIPPKVRILDIPELADTRCVQQGGPTRGSLQHRSRTTSTPSLRFSPSPNGTERRVTHNRYILTCSLYFIQYIPKIPVPQRFIYVHQRLKPPPLELLLVYGPLHTSRRSSVPPQQPDHAPEEVPQAQGRPKHEGTKDGVARRSEDRRVGRLGCAGESI